MAVITDKETRIKETLTKTTPDGRPDFALAVSISPVLANLKEYDALIASVQASDMGAWPDELIDAFGIAMQTAKGYLK